MILHSLWLIAVDPHRAGPFLNMFASHNTYRWHGRACATLILKPSLEALNTRTLVYWTIRHCHTRRPANNTGRPWATSIIDPLRMPNTLVDWQMAAELVTLFAGPNQLCIINSLLEYYYYY